LIPSGPGLTLAGGGPPTPHPEEGALEDTLLDAYEKEIRIRIGGKEILVPENNTLLRILQHLAFEISYSRFCWNGECQNCLVSYRSGKTEKKALACRVKVTEGMEISRLPEGIDLN